MKDITRDIPTTLILPGTGTIVTRLTIPIINPLSKENTGLILRDGASTMNVTSVKIIGTEGIDLKDVETKRWRRSISFAILIFGLGSKLPVVRSEWD